MKMLMKNKVARALALVALWALPWLATSEAASSEGSMRVAREGELPAGYFAMAAGYLPGDTISVTVESTGSSLQVLNVGSLDEGEGLVMLLSKEAAAVLGIAGVANGKVNLTNRAGYFDETALGYCTVKGSFAAPAKALGSAVASSDAASAAALEPTEEKVSVVSDEAKPAAPVVAATPVVVMAPEPERPVESELVLVEAPGPLVPVALAPASKVTPAVKEEIVPREELVVLTPPASEASTPAAPVYEKVEVEELAATTSAKPAPKAPVEELVLVEVPRVTPVPKEEPVAVFDEPSVTSVSTPEVASTLKEELFVPDKIAEIDTDETAELDEDFSEVVVVYDDSEPLLALAEPKGELVESDLPREEVAVAPAPVEEGAYSPIVLVPVAPSRPPVSSKSKTEPIAISPVPVAAESESAPEPALEITSAPVAAESVAPAPVAASESVASPAVEGAAEAAARVVADESALQKDCYYIQIATLGSQKNIDNTLQKYAKYPIVLVPATNPALHKVLVGPLSVDEYGAVLSKFKDAGYKDAFVKKR